MPSQDLAERIESANAADPAFRKDILAGLSTMPKATPARWLYDKRGSELFEEITALPESYPTRVETELLRTHGEENGPLVGSGRAVDEVGSGSALTTPHFPSQTAHSAYFP